MGLLGDVGSKHVPEPKGIFVGGLHIDVQLADDRGFAAWGGAGRKPGLGSRRSLGHLTEREGVRAPLPAHSSNCATTPSRPPSVSYLEAATR